MKRHLFLQTLVFILANALLFSGCSTVETRIAGNPDMFQRLSPRDQQLVREGRIREGMSMDGVWLAWGTPNQKGVGFARGQRVESWIYNEFVYSSAPYGFPWGPYGYGGYWGGPVVFRSYGGCRFAVVGSPFYDPFLFARIPPRLPYPAKTVTFANGRVVSLQFLTAPPT